MKYPLRTLSQVRNFRRATEGQLGAEQVAVCGICGSRWRVDLDEAARELGDAATGRDLEARANCPNCSGGLCRDTYVVIDTDRIRRPVWYPGLFDRHLDTSDAFATEKPIAVKPRRRPR